MTFKSPEEAMEKDCIFRLMIKMLFKPDYPITMEEDFEKCTGSDCAQYGRGVHRCGLV